MGATSSGPKKDNAKDIKSYVKGMDQSLPTIIGGEDKWRPKFQALNLSDVNSSLNGLKGEQGLIAAGGAAQQAAQGQLNSARAWELQNMAGNTGSVRNILASMSPEAAAAVSRAQQTAQNAQGLEAGFTGRAAGIMSQYGSQVGQYTPTLGGINGAVGAQTSEAQAQSLYNTGMAQQMAQEAYARRGTLSQEEQRAAQQSAREASVASGRIGGNGSIAAEVLNRESAMAGRRAEASGMGQQAYTQGMGALQQQLAAQNSRYSQLSADHERELGRLNNLFGQNLAAGQQNQAERQLGFGQMMDIEQKRALMREEAAMGNARSYDMGQGFYSQPGMQMLGMAPASLGLGGDYLGKGMLSIGQGTPKLYDTSVALGIAAADRTNAFNAAAAQAGRPNAGAAAGAGALSGAAAGAMIGSVVPVVGTAIGALGGAIIGGAGGYFGSR
jgi:hypothetical protein